MRTRPKAQGARCKEKYAADRMRMQPRIKEHVNNKASNHKGK
jgi:hypothetical protein